MKTHLKAATGEFRNNWHKYLPLAVLNHNTTYHASLGCEPSRVFHGRIPHNILDYKLGYNPNPRYQPQSDVAEEIQKRMKTWFSFLVLSLFTSASPQRATLTETSPREGPRS